MFQDLRNLAIVKADLNVDSEQDLANFNLMLDILITSVERMADYEQKQKDGPES